MDSNTLREIYAKITGYDSKYMTMDNLIVECVLSNKFNEFVPYLHQINFRSMGGLFKIRVHKHEYFDREYLQYGGYWGAPPLSLFEILVCYKKFHHVLKYILENYEVFFCCDIRRAVKYVLKSMMYNDYLSTKYSKVYVDYESKNMKLLLDFCGNVDIIQMINKHQKSPNFNYMHDMKFVYCLVSLYDSEYKYNVTSPGDFLEKHIRNGWSIENKFRRYNLIEHSNEYELDKLMFSTLIYRNAGAYLLLHEMGLRCKTDWVLFTGFDERVLNTAPAVDSHTLIECIRKYIVSVVYTTREITVPECVKVIEKLVPNLKEFLIELKNTITYNASDDSSITRLFSMLFVNAPDLGFIYYADMPNLTNNYSMDVMFQNNNCSDTWKQNFKLMNNFGSNFPSYHS